LGWVKKYPGKRRVSLLFTAGQKHAWVGSGQGPSLILIAKMVAVYILDRWIRVLINKSGTSWFEDQVYFALKCCGNERPMAAYLEMSLTGM